MGTSEARPASGHAGSALADLVPGTRGAEKPRVFLWEAAAAAVRVVGSADAPWFVAKDVCAVLEIQNVSQALGGLDDDEKGVSNTYTLGGAQDLLTVNESGLYALIFRSRKEQARVFRKWVTSEVLPQIRRTGAYNGVPTLARHTIEIHHRPAAPEVVPTTEEALVAQLLYTLLNKKDRGVFHGTTIVDLARRDEEFAGWFVPCRPHPFRQRSGEVSGFLRRLVAYFGRPLTGCFASDARVQITPHGEGAQRRYVFTSWRVTEARRYDAQHSALEAVEIVSAALRAGGEVIVK